MPLILATTSPFRKEIFGFLSYPFITEDSKIEENFEGRPDKPEELVITLARMKAESVAKRHQVGIVIGCDSLCWHDGNILEKPVSKHEAYERLRSFSGNKYQFYSGLHMIDISSGKELSRVVRTDVYIRDLTDREILDYLEKDPNFSRIALGYDSQKHYSSTFTKKIEGSIFNYIGGLPIEAVAEMLNEFGYKP